MAGLRTMLPAASTRVGTITDEMETNNAEVSNSTKNKELDVRPANSKHAKRISQVRII